jgi:hypothetical protein
MYKNNINKINYFRKLNVRNDIVRNDIDYSLIENILAEKINRYKDKLNINLIVSYYKDKHIERCKELDLCLKLNCSNKLFNKIIILNETGQEIDWIKSDDRITILNITNRLMFCDFFNYANKYSNNDTINILINSDIVIGENFNINLNNDEIYVLTRYDLLYDGSIKFNDDYGSFDTWIWKGLIKNNDIGKYYMGVPCCDVLLSYEFHKDNYKLKNPCLDLKTYHVHNTNIRNYTILHKIDNEKYMKVIHTNLDTDFTINDYIIF